MKFCEHCNNKLCLFAQPTSTELLLRCRTCGTTMEVEDDGGDSTGCVYSTHQTKDESFLHHFVVNPYTKFDRTLPTIAASCQNEKCDSHSAGHEKRIVYIKYDRKNLKYLYLCCTCDTYWTVTPST